MAYSDDYARRDREGVIEGWNGQLFSTCSRYRLSTSARGFCRLLVTLVAIVFHVSPTFGQGLTIRTAGNGSYENILYVLQLLSDLTETEVTRHGVSGKVTIGEGGNELAAHLREISNSNVSVVLGVCGNAAGVTKGMWYRDVEPAKHQLLDVSDLSVLPRSGDAETVGSTAFAVLYHEIEQMYVGKQDPQQDPDAFKNAHNKAIDAENTVYRVWGNKGRRKHTKDPRAVVFYEGAGVWRTFTPFEVNGTDWTMEGKVLNSGPANPTVWARNWLGDPQVTVPNEDLQWEGYTSYPVPEHGTLLALGIGLGMAASRSRRKSS
ncbi:MAG: hypothetical protein HONBIEJF_01504 [Fimbriimonadaceae bacterium]|nr:hypothetical protein [Fimbriimonadaceae bacterium]